jgi:hypothetical protein
MNLNSTLTYIKEDYTTIYVVDNCGYNSTLYQRGKNFNFDKNTNSYIASKSFSIAIDTPEIERKILNQYMKLMETNNEN